MVPRLRAALGDAVDTPLWLVPAIRVGQRGCGCTCGAQSGEKEAVGGSPEESEPVSPVEPRLLIWEKRGQGHISLPFTVYCLPIREGLCYKLGKK